MSQKENYEQLLRLWAIMKGIDEKNAEAMFRQSQRRKLRDWEIEEILIQNAENGAPMPNDITKGEIRAARKRFHANTHLKPGICYGDYCRRIVLSKAARRR